MELEIKKDKNFIETITKLKNYFKPEKIYLFGSRAKGLQSADSDYDLFLIVKQSNKSVAERMKEANDVLWGRRISVDVFIYTEEEFNEYKQDVNSIAFVATTEGMEL
jgi:uncharacterized protein